MLLNLFTFIIAETRIGRKSTAIQKADEAIENTDSNLKIAQAFTPEYFLKELANKTVQSSRGFAQTNATWLNDEVSFLFDQLAKERSYMAGMDAILSKVHDGRDVTRGSIGRSKEEILNPYFTACIASTR